MKLKAFYDFYEYFFKLILAKKPIATNLRDAKSRDQRHSNAIANPDITIKIRPNRAPIASNGVEFARNWPIAAKTPFVLQSKDPRATSANVISDSKINQCRPPNPGPFVKKVKEFEKKISKKYQNISS